MKLRLRDGSELDAVATRVSRPQDVALLRPTKPLSGHRCAVLRTEVPSSGSEVYAAGGSDELGARLLADARDWGAAFRSSTASVDCRPSSRRARATAAGRSWTPAAPSSASSRSRWRGPESRGSASRSRLPRRSQRSGYGSVMRPIPSRHRDAALGACSCDIPLNKDTADAAPSLDPDADCRAAEARARRREAEEERAVEEDRDWRTSVFVPIMRWTGLGVSFAGLGMALITNAKYRPGDTTEADFGRLRFWNTVGWVATGVGAGSFALSFALRAPRIAKGAAASTLQIVSGCRVMPGRSDEALVVSRRRGTVGLPCALDLPALALLSTDADCTGGHIRVLLSYSQVCARPDTAKWTPTAPPRARRPACSVVMATGAALPPARPTPIVGAVTVASGLPARPRARATRNARRQPLQRGGLRGALTDRRLLANISRAGICGTTCLADSACASSFCVQQREVHGAIVHGRPAGLSAAVSPASAVRANRAARRLCWTATTGSPVDERRLRLQRDPRDLPVQFPVRERGVPHDLHLERRLPARAHVRGR